PRLRPVSPVRPCACRRCSWRTPRPRARPGRAVSLALLRSDQTPAYGMIDEPHLARGLRLQVVGEARIVRPRVDVQAHRALVERIGDAMNGVLALLQIDAADGRALDSAARHEPDTVAGARSIERVEVFQAQRTFVDGQPAELVCVVVDRARRARG